MKAARKDYLQYMSALETFEILKYPSVEFRMNIMASVGGRFSI